MVEETIVNKGWFSQSKCLKTNSDIHGRGNHGKEGMVMPNEVCKIDFQIDQLDNKISIINPS